MRAPGPVLAIPRHHCIEVHPALGFSPSSAPLDAGQAQAEPKARAKQTFLPSHGYPLGAERMKIQGAKSGRCYPWAGRKRMMYYSGIPSSNTLVFSPETLYKNTL